MQVQLEKLTDTSVKLTISADQEVMDQVKSAVVERLGRDIRVPGFRPGKAPKNLIEKNVNPAQLQTEFLEQAVNHLYVQAIQHEKLRPAAQPEISILKFVPFTTLEFSATLEAVGEVKLADHKKLRLKMEITTVTPQDVTTVLEDLRQRAATREPVERAAKTGDAVVIDFKGRDAKTNEPISGADGTGYPLVLGSDTFIPGFEAKLVGIKPAAETEFTLTFPKDYGMASLQGRKVIFAVTVQSVQSVTKPKADDVFAATVGPFKTLAELKVDIKKQLVAEKRRTDQQSYESKLLQMLTEKSQVIIPDVLIEEEMNRMEAEEKRNVAYRGQTWQEHLTAEGVTAEAHRTRYRPEAEKRLKAGLTLAEVAEREKLEVTDEELNAHIAELKQQYSSDAAMQTELSKPENRRDLAGRLLNQKVLDTLRDYANK
jgi:trigger factor